MSSSDRFLSTPPRSNQKHDCCCMYPASRPAPRRRPRVRKAVLRRKLRGRRQVRPTELHCHRPRWTLAPRPRRPQGINPWGRCHRGTPHRSRKVEGKRGQEVGRSCRSRRTKLVRDTSRCAQKMIILLFLLLGFLFILVVFALLFFLMLLFELC